jgi:hypothetical protein
MADPRDVESLLNRFEVAWQEGTPPALEEFVPAVLGADRPARPELLHELVKIDLEYRWRRRRRGRRAAGPRLEDYARRLPGLGSARRLPIDLIGEEYRVRQRWGDRPAPEEYAERFPRHGSALVRALSRIDAELAAEAGASDGPPSPPGSVRLGCPDCGQPLDVAAGPLPSDLACPGCGGTFGVDPLASARPPSSRVGRYELGELLGMGAFGSVWRARDTELGREVAVKLPRGGRLAGPDDEERFLREARAAALLRHPGIVAVFDVGRDGETLFLVSELVRGVSLAERLKAGRPSFRESAALVARVADALDYAHRQGVVHRDVKPANVLLELDESSETGELGRPRVTDFGLAKRDVGEVTLTRDGQFLGTPAYVSPEQVRDPHAVDGRGDVYSLGVILYELLTGELPFRGAARMMLLQVVSDEPRPPRQLNDAVSRDLETICLKCLRKEPGRRYRTAAALAADLRRWLAGEPILARPVGHLERLWSWSRRHAALAVAVTLLAVALVAVTGAPAAALLLAATAGSLLYALHKAREAAGLARVVAELTRNQRKTAAALRWALDRLAQDNRTRDRNSRPPPPRD